MRLTPKREVALVVALCLATRLPQLMSDQSFLDGDECVVALMAKHVVDGVGLPLYFYGQVYGFSLLEVLPISLAYLVLGVGQLAVKLAMLAMWTLGVVFFHLALRRLGLPYAVFEKLLWRFAEDQSNTLAALRAALGDQDWDTARRHAHSMAGAAGNVSADTLCTRAKTLELALKDQAGGYEPLYHELRAEAEQVFAAIDGVKKAPASTEATPPMDTPMDLGQLVTALEELEARLSEGDPDAVLSALDHARALNMGDALRPECNRLQALVDDFDFFTAADLVAAMRTQLINPQQT